MSFWRQKFRWIHHIFRLHPYVPVLPRPGIVLSQTVKHFENCRFYLAGRWKKNTIGKARSTVETGIGIQLFPKQSSDLNWMSFYIMLCYETLRIKRISKISASFLEIWVNQGNVALRKDKICNINKCVDSSFCLDSGETSCRVTCQLLLPHIRQKHRPVWKSLQRACNERNQF